MENLAQIFLKRKFGKEPCTMRKFLLLAMLCALAAPFASAGLIVGTPAINEANCYPFSCFASDGGTLYQEVYSSSAFPGTISISSLSFFAWSGGAMDDATYTVDLSTTPSNVGDGYPLTVGADNQLFGTFHISGNMPPVLTLAGAPFNYDPSNGNLLMQVTVGTVNSTCSYCSFFEADYIGTVVSRAWVNGYGPDSGTGALVTDFNIPEPGSLGLFAFGLTGLAVLIRRRK